MFQDKKLYTFRDAGFYQPMIKKAEEIEKKRFVDLYNKIHKTKYTERELVDNLGVMTGITDYWKRMYIDNLDFADDSLDIMGNNLEDEAWKFLGDLWADIASKGNDIAIYLMLVLLKLTTKN